MNYIAVSQNSLSGQKETEKKLKELTKFETKIEQNLETHKKSLTFFQENDNCPVCTQKIDDQFKANKCEHEKNTITKLEKGLVQARRRNIKTRTKSICFTKISDKISDMKLQMAKISSSLESLKNQSDQIQQDIDRVNEKDNDIETLNLN